jgi:hypothetical protein
LIEYWWNLVEDIGSIILPAFWAMLVRKALDTLATSHAFFLQATFIKSSILCFFSIPIYILPTLHTT